MLNDQRKDQYSAGHWYDFIHKTTFKVTIQQWQQEMSVVYIAII